MKSERLRKGPKDAADQFVDGLFESRSLPFQAKNSAASLITAVAKRESFVPDVHFHKRERRLIFDDLSVAKKLRTEREAARAQQAKQEDNGYFRTVNPQSTYRLKTSKTEINGRSIGIAHDQGMRRSMEDEDLVAKGKISIQGRELPYELFSIFDGHGGGGTSRFLKENLQKFIHAELASLETLTDCMIWNALKAACVKLDERAKNRGDESGSTGVIALRIQGDLWIANVGDSRAILGNREGAAIQLSEDAKPDDPKYRRSIEKRGGFVWKPDTWRVNGTLAVARSFNDRTVQSGNGTYCISARPKITKIPKEEIHPGDFLILCCDGIPDVASSRDIIARAAKNRNPEKAASDLVGAAYAAGSSDNLSAMVIPF